MNAITLALLLTMLPIQSVALLPWTTFSDAAKHTIAAELGLCPGGETFVARLSSPDGRFHQYWFAVETNRLVWAVYPAKTAELPSEVGLGVLAPDAGDQIPIMRWIPWAEMTTQNPCDLLFPASA